MYKTFRFLIFAFIVFSNFGITQSSVDKREIDSEFTRAVELYNAQRYNSALFRFEKIINGYDLNSKTSAAYFFKIKILIENEEFGDANYFCSSTHGGNCRPVAPEWAEYLPPKTRTWSADGLGVAGKCRHVSAVS